MSEQTSEVEKADNESTQPAEQLASTESPPKKRPEHVYLVPYPNVVFLYPSFIVALVAAIGMSFVGEEAIQNGSRFPHLICNLFLSIFTINLIVLTLEFPRAAVLTLFFIASTIIMGIVLLTTFAPDFLPWVQNLAFGLQPFANASFFWTISGILGAILITAKIAVQFDYWEVRQNELLHHHGILSDLRRYPTAGLQVEKEINDVFEFMLLRSGKLILRPQGISRDLVLENIPFIDTKESDLTRLLGARKVEIRND